MDVIWNVPVINIASIHYLTNDAQNKDSSFNTLLPALNRRVHFYIKGKLLY